MTDKDFLKKIIDDQNKFWLEEYTKLNRQEKVKYWLATTHKGMRTQGESFADEYSEFSKKWYDHANVVEPDFDSIFKEAMNDIGFEFDWEEYNKRIQE
ncbi:hypothetical protein [uncultured Psychroserpens sp.]|uniref:hypothetical protein n=1 Tax=uncultured Psychroserpens sp. TaxID=255436 RepID=UPI002623AB46|nr:hypothetical protein [uncultured Psychroserpens sp.]